MRLITLNTTTGRSHMIDPFCIREVAPGSDDGATVTYEVGLGVVKAVSVRDSVDDIAEFIRDVEL